MGKEKVVILNSGGIDSRAMAKIINKERYELHSLHILTPSVPNSERQAKAAQITADLFCNTHEIAIYDFKYTGVYFNKEEQKYILNDGISKEDYEKVSKTRLHCAPFWRTVVYGFAFSYARAIGANIIISGQTQYEALDWANTFAKLTNESCPFKDRGPSTFIRVEMPLAGMDESAIAGLLTEQEYGTTVSCNQLDDCGRCYACARKIRFEEWKRNKGDT